ncbi:hypothetical protein BD410DRAFT_785810 [Rickenella mellea]|uniref:Uncharacterized protein n=1 Tax=Rickenella mellea TaxID=50990 RepID=A0A4Y7QCG0_9AGAM|nr:hypothetical protein BD410DRAFT_785810 [Rickenella mellea]
MAGPSLEVVKFAIYLFFPLGMMVHYTKPEWYMKNVLPYKDRLFPQEKTIRDIPTETSQLRDKLARIKAEKLAQRLERERKQ